MWSGVPSSVRPHNLPGRNEEEDIVKYFCCDEKRRERVNEHPTLNGIDFIEVQADPHQLSVHFLKPDNVAELQAENLRIEGGERIRGVVVTPQCDARD